MKYIYIIILMLVSMTAYGAEMKEAYFAGGCFWCMEAPFEEVEGVQAAVSGYAGGEEESPSYKDVAAGKTGHREAVRVTYDAQKISYVELLDIFWRQIDPTDDGGQFVDRGFQYTTAIFYTSDEERELAEATKRDLETKGIHGGNIVTAIIPHTTFYRAEEEHQNYYRDHKIKYKYYRSRSGRDDYLEGVWGKE